MFYEVIRRKWFQVCGISKSSQSRKGGLQTASQTLPEPQSLLSALSPLRPSFPLHSFIPEYADPSLRPSDERSLGLEHSSLTHCLTDSFLFSLGRFSPAPTSSSPHYTLSYPLPGTTVGSTMWGLLSTVPAQRPKGGRHPCPGDG